MFVKQISVFLENKPGQLGKITETLKDGNIDIRAFSIAATGRVSIRTDKMNEAYEVLKSKGIEILSQESI